MIEIWLKAILAAALMVALQLSVSYGAALPPDYWVVIEKQFGVKPISDGSKIADFDVLGALRVSQGQSKLSHRTNMLRLQAYFQEFYQRYADLMKEASSNMNESRRRELLVKKKLANNRAEERLIENEITSINRFQVNAMNEIRRQLIGYRLVIKTKPAKVGRHVSRIVLERPRQISKAMLTKISLKQSR